MIGRCLNIADSHINMKINCRVGGVPVTLGKDALKRMFPNLAREMKSDEVRIPINSFRTEAEVGERAASRDFVHYTPDVVDFIRRCDTEEQAEEIVTYMEKRGEIEKQSADNIRKQLKEKGVRSFGPKKEHDYYLRHGES